MVLLITCIILFILYSLLILYYWLRWKAIPDRPLAAGMRPGKISVVVAARNEEDHIGRLLEALTSQSYPSAHTELIVVDDHSTDSTAAIVQRYPQVKLVTLQTDPLNSYKKKAIEAGIAASTGDLIVTTDADCVPPTSWLESIAAAKKETDAVFIAAPVVFSNDHSLLQLFQSLDFLVLQGITAAAVTNNNLSMCNGANLAYDRNAFYEVNGFSGIDQIASGDDMLLMHKISQRFPGRVCYLKSKQALVVTEPMKTWKTFFNQRIRWASKAKYYDDKRIFAVLLLVYLFNLSFAVLAIAGFWCPVYWLYGAGLLVGKTLIELPFVYSVASFFNKTALLTYFPLFQPLHIIYTIVAGILGQIGKYEWKGRKVR